MTEEKEPVGVSAVREDNKMTTDALPVIMNWSGAVLPGVVTFVFKCYGVADLTTQHNLDEICSIVHINFMSSQTF